MDFREEIEVRLKGRSLPPITNLVVECEDNIGSARFDLNEDYEIRLVLGASASVPENNGEAMERAKHNAIRNMKAFVYSDSVDRLHALEQVLYMVGVYDQRVNKALEDLRESMR